MSIFRPLLGMTLCFSSSFGWSATHFTVSTSGDSHLPYGTFNPGTNQGDLRGCLFQINKIGTAQDYVVSFGNEINTIELGGILPPIGLNTTPTSILIDGSGGANGHITVDGGGIHPGFFAYLPGVVTFKNINIHHTVSQGGSGSGGAMGAGGALFVAQQTTAVLENMEIVESQAIGGNGAFGRSGRYGSGGGGMCKGNGGPSSESGWAGGGGGFGGNGGQGFESTGCGGGGGISPYGDGEGILVTGAGGSGSASGSAGGGVPGESGGSNYYGTYVGGSYCGGGGGSRSLAEDSGGGGGVGGQNAIYLGGAGNGGPFGGGGGSFARGGDGGVYGGGGACHSSAGVGGFGGGGGGGDYEYGYRSGDGGFGGGGGGGTGPGIGGIGGGNGSINGGGGGAAMGGGIFVAQGGSLTIQGAFKISDCGLQSGSGGALGSGNGAAVASGLFFHTNDLTNGVCRLLPGSNQSIILASDVADDNVLNIPSGQSYHSGGSGQFSLYVGGTGETILTSESVASHTGQTRVAGLLRVNGVIPYSPVILESGGILKGTGIIGSSVSVHSGAILAPGNSIGSLSVDSVLFDDSSMFQVEISPTQASLLNISGVASLSGMVHLIPESGLYPSQGQYLILRSGELLGAFDGTEGGMSGYIFRLEKIGNDVYLQYTLQKIPLIGLSGNAKKMATYLNNNENASILSQFVYFTPSQLQEALNSISPARNAFGSYICSQLSFAMTENISTHLDVSTSQPISDKRFVADASDKVYAFPKTNKYQAWMSGFGEFAHQKSSWQNPSFDYNSGTALVGFDYGWNQKNVVGTCLGYVHTHFYENQNAGDGNINSYGVAFYGKGWIEDFYLSSVVWGIFNQIDQTRKISFTGFSQKARADIFGWQLVPHLEMGYAHKCIAGDVVPFTAIDWAIVWQRAYTEKGALSFNARQSGQNNSMIRSETGLKVSQHWNFDWGVLSIREKASYVFEKLYGMGQVNASFVGMSGSFTVFALNQTLNLGAIGVNLGTFLGKDQAVCLDLGYQGEFGVNYRSNEVLFTASKKF